jgi:hypothetical protein
MAGVLPPVITAGGYYRTLPPPITIQGSSSSIYPYTSFYNLGLLPVEVGEPVTVNQMGAYLNPSYGATNTFRMGLGLPGYFNAGTGNWVIPGDSVNNGGLFVLNDGFYVVPSTGGTNQSVTPANLINYKVAEFTTGGLNFMGTAPTCAVTGFASAAPTCLFTSGSNNNDGIMYATAGAGSAASGTFTLTFSSPLGTNNAVCHYTLFDNGSGAWNARATAIAGMPTGPATMITASVVNWDNNSAALTSAAVYTVSYICGGT